MKHFFKKILAEKGFTLIEVLIGGAITTLIGTVITVSLWQTINIDSASNKQMLALNQIENALFYLNRDVQMSVPDPGYVSGFPLTLVGEEVVVYNIVTPVDGTPAYLERTDEDSSTIIARYVNADPMLTTCQYDGKLEITLTVTTGGFMSATESRTLVVTPRMNLARQ